MGRSYFVSGIGTSVGKTVATGAMAAFLAGRGVRTATAKPVQTGNAGFSEDIAEHRRIMGCGELPEDAEALTCPQIFAFPSSPELAARLEGRAVDLEKIAMALDELERRFEIVLVEGAGGLAVPLTPDVLTVEWIASRRLPLILTAAPYLGSLNHAILSIDCAISHGLELAGIVYNLYPETDARIERDTRDKIVSHLARRGLRTPVVDLPRGASRDRLPDFSAFFLEVLP